MSNGSQPNVQDVIDYENGDMDWDRLVDFFQNLIDSEASCLDDEDGDYAIMVRSLIVDGYCESKEVK